MRGDDTPAFRQPDPCLHCRPILPGTVSRSNSVEAVAKSRPKVVITVREMRRARPIGARATRNADISSLP
jgi:hypothetical protein